MQRVLDKGSHKYKERTGKKLIKCEFGRLKKQPVTIW